MRLRDFHYELPESLIAQQPSARRGDSRLLHVPAGEGGFEDRQFRDLATLLRAGDLMVFNDTRVLPARLHGVKETGGRVEVLIERLLSETRALAHIRASKSPKPGSRIQVGDDWLLMEERRGELFCLQVEDGTFAAMMQTHGHMPLPPYIQRPDTELDQERYQTVYGDRPGAVAAPTAGLHFDRDMLGRLDELGVETTRVTLHVGAGTFQPVRAQDIAEHRMHSEWLEVGEGAVNAVRGAQARGGRVVAVGTTAVRSLETAASAGVLAPFTGDTRLFITPGFRFRVVDALLTNFHLPESTLLMLVSAFAGHARTLAAYRHAVEQRYRFFSYGDAMFLERHT